MREALNVRQPNEAVEPDGQRVEAIHLMPTYRRAPLVIERGQGCWVYDVQGRRYLDFLSGIGVNALGYGHPRLLRVLQDQAARVVHVSNLYHHPFQEPLAARLAQLTGLERVFFTNSGSEAVETALKLARAYAAQRGRQPTRWLALEGSFHGRTFGALSVTAPEAYRRPFAPLIPGVEFVRFDDVADLERKFDASVGALIVEPVQGEGGIRPLSEAFWRRARELTRRWDALLIADEIQCGLGRTGRWFAWQKWGEPPDVITLAKPLGGGLPLGAVVARAEVAEAFRPGLHGSTFGGGPLACAVALEFLRVVEDEHLLENVRQRGRQLRQGLERLARTEPSIVEVRGEGLMIGIELDRPAEAIVERARAAGLLINCTHERVLRLLPPYVVRREDVEDFLERLATVMRQWSRREPPTGTSR